MLLSKLTPGAAKTLTRPEEVVSLPPPPPFSHRRWTAMPSSVPLARFRLSLGVCWEGLLLGCLPDH
jgi:hypothetical protein